MTPIQLSLFPLRGFGLLAVTGELLEDWRTGGPYFVRTRRAATRQAAKTHPWMRAAVVKLTVHEGDEIPTFVVEGT